MGSVGTGEILVILVIALIVFGPERLPELARKAGEALAKIRGATRSLTESLDGDYQDVVAPIKDLKAEYDSTVNEIKGVAATVGGLTTNLDGSGTGDTPAEPRDADREAAESADVPDGDVPPGERES